MAETLHDDVLRLVTARRNVRRRRRISSAGGRPLRTRCPGCSLEMSSSELRDHRVGCVRDELQKARGLSINLTPKDPDPYPAFSIARINDDTVEFRKMSNDDHITVDLRKIAEITTDQAERVAHIRLLGRVAWHPEIGRTGRWRFEPTAPVGRPPQV